MDKDELQKNIATYFSKLPPMAQDFFSKMDWLKRVQEIGIKFGLNDKQQESLTTETVLVLLGIIHPVEYEENLERELGLAKNTQEKINLEIENSILKTVKQQVIETFNAHKKDEAEKPQEKPLPTNPAYSLNLSQKLDARFDSLPENLKEVIEKSNFQAGLYGLSQKYKLNVEQMGMLDNATVDLMIGAIQPNEFEDRLLDTLGLSEDDTSTLVDEINNQIFREIREKLVATLGTTANRQNNEQSLETEDLPIVPEKDLKTLKSHGIEIVDEEKPTPKMPEIAPSKILEGKEEPLEIQAPKAVATPAPTQPSIPKITPTINIHPLLDKKMSGPVQTLVSKNQYGINNVPIKAEEKAVTTGSDTKTSGYKAGQDPYRIKPGE